LLSLENFDGLDRMLVEAAGRIMNMDRKAEALEDSGPDCN
jgi:hypothetical protein